ncbi:SPOR domain-containing protein [Tenacibaculum sp. TC6]|uniref:SPOR domain-containing protein n=1 Tax=Tenacibaculum sp. TC6 TaxID=3423223 RepID=UPI003D3647C6
MPFIEEAKYQLMQEDIDTAKLKLEESEKELNELQESYKHQKQKSRTIIVLLFIFLGIAIGVIYLFKNGTLNSEGIIVNNNNTVDIEEIKAKEAQRVIDSLNNANEESNLDNASLSEENLDETLGKISKNSKGSTVYSVQIGVFSKNKYPLLSKAMLSGIAVPDDGYFKYSLGIFASLDEAKKLKNELVKVGFKDAFVASYINGKRQQIHH